MNYYKRYRLTKDYTCPDGTLLAGSDIDVFGDKIMFNGGMIQPQYYQTLKELITVDELRKEYIREVPIPYNKV
jgi:hypothetical protein